MNEPIGRFGSCRPARDAANRARHGLYRITLADHPLRQLVFHAQQLVALAFEHLVDRDAGPAGDDMGDVVGRDDFLHHRVAAPRNPGFPRLPVPFPASGSRHRQAPRPAGIRPCAGRSPVRCAPRRAASSGRRRGRASDFSACQRAVSASACSSSPVRSISSFSSRSFEARSVSFFRASRSIFSWMMRRSSSSSSSGLESTCIRSRDAASSIRSIALSGRNRSVM